MVTDNFEATRFPEYFDYPTAMRSRISKKNAPQVNAFRQNCSQDGNNYQDYDLILGVPAKRASIMDVHAATDAKYLSNVEDVLDVF